MNGHKKETVFFLRRSIAVVSNNYPLGKNVGSQISNVFTPRGYQTQICKFAESAQTSHIQSVTDLLFPEFLAASSTTAFLTGMASMMITPSVFLSLICLVAVVSASDSDESDGCSETANYLLSFYGLWKEDRHPNTPLPGNAHFSPLVGCSHGSDYVMWRPGAKAPAGVELVAETG